MRGFSRISEQKLLQITFIRFFLSH